MEKILLPIGFALWASIASAGTFVWLTAPDGPVEEGQAEGEPIVSGPIAVFVSGAEGVHYLTFKIRYVADPSVVRTMPVEAAAKDMLIEAAHRSAALGKADGWRTALSAAFEAGVARLGVSSVSVLRAERRPAP